MSLPQYASNVGALVAKISQTVFVEHWLIVEGAHPTQNSPISFKRLYQYVYEINIQNTFLMIDI